MRILLADDSILILERLQEILKSFIQIELKGAFRNGYEALEALRDQKPDLAILDFNMPGLSGLEVLKEIRKENKQLKVIILTLRSLDIYRHLALQAGADYFFSKADDFEKLSPLLADILVEEKTNLKMKLKILRKRRKFNNSKKNMVSVK